MVHRPLIPINDSHLTRFADQVKAVHGRTYPQGHDWSVVYKYCEPQSKYTALAIVYTKPGSLAEWTVVEMGSQRFERSHALESLFEKTQEMLMDESK